jgi:enterochelin esterase family protein
MMKRRVFIGASAAAMVAQRAKADDNVNPKAYLAGADFQPFAGPTGTMREFMLEESRIFPGYRHWWGIYTPAPAFTTKPPALMVLQDGPAFSNREGPWRVPDVLDHMIARREVPPMVVVFVAPGTLQARPDQIKPRASDRSLEYDTLSTRYADFLLQEILPLAQAIATWRDDPDDHAIGGHSSGAICAFTVAWNRPDKFRKVYSANGSFTNIRGGDAYPGLVRTQPKRPLRVYQWSDTHDMSRPDWGDWATANHAMAAALDAAGYDHLFEFGEGTHNPIYAAARFQGALRWLWRG